MQNVTINLRMALARLKLRILTLDDYNQTNELSFENTTSNDSQKKNNNKAHDYLASKGPLAFFV